MNSLAQLDQLNLDTATKQQVVNLVQAFQFDLTQQTQQMVYALELKIQALTLELAHLRRIRFGRKNEALSALSPRQLSLFEESALTDITAIEAEIEQINSTPPPNTTKVPRTRAGRQPLPDHLPRIIVFDYQAGRSGQHARHFLQNWQGHLMVDDYAGYKALFSTATSPCVELACWAHARRKFFDLHQANASTMALAAIQRISVLYAIEAEGKDLSIEDRLQLRADRSLPALHALHDWLMQTRSQTANGGGSAKALDYTLRRWPSLIRYAQTGFLPIDNNPVENTIRPIAIGKKNWLFTGSERAGQRAAAIQTLFGTAQLNKLDPAAWLADTLARLPTWPNNRIDELLPLTPAFIQSLKQQER
ncbi:MAG: IS66 family transposase [Nitrosomonas sp.]|nr:IS66 family transposase [Nitrosomonas sp.]